MIKKHLIFHFFIPDDYETNVAIKMHYACLWKYSNVFDSAEFFISSTEESKIYIGSVKQSLINVFQCKDIRFKEVENDPYFEARTFKENVLYRIEEYEETMVFFGHTKGVRDVVMFEESKEFFLKWIYALYFYSLEFVKEAELKLFTIFHGRKYTFFGSLPLVYTDGTNCIFAGAFYWTNPMTLRKDIKSGEVIPKSFNDRAFAEEFPSIYKRTFNNGFVMCKTGGHNCIEGNWDDFEFFGDGNFDDIAMHFGEYDKFIEGYNELINEIQ